VLLLLFVALRFLFVYSLWPLYLIHPHSNAGFGGRRRRRRRRRREEGEKKDTVCHIPPA